MDRFSQRSFTVRDILRHEAEALSKYGPSRGEPKEPESHLETFTRLCNFGPGVCRVKQWPNDEDPYEWGCRNEALLLDESIHSPAKWEVEEEYWRFRCHLERNDYTDLRGIKDSDGGYEAKFLVVLNSILRRLTITALVFFIQLWRRNPQHTSHPDYHIAFEILHHLGLEEVRTSSKRHDAVSITLPRTSYLHSRERYEGYQPSVIGTVQRTGFTEKIHAANERGCRTMDEILSSVLDDTDEDTNNLFRKFGLRNDWQSVAVGHIIQMSSVASRSTSQMGFSTSIWGYLRFFMQIESSDGRAPILYITRNMAIDTAWSDDSRTDDSSNFKLLCQIYYFIIMALLKTKGPRILPPDLRQNECLLNFFSPKPFNFFSRCSFLPRLALRRISGLVHVISFSLLASLWEFVLHYWGTSVLAYVGYLRIQSIEGNLMRISEDVQIRGSKVLYLRFDSWDVRKVTEVGINRRAGLVLKVFHTQKMFESELRAYLVLQEAGVEFIPQLLGVFNVPGTKGAMLLTMVGEGTEGPFNLDDRRHLSKTIRNIHKANIHHHDLQNNIVCGADGWLRIIDFGHSSTAEECKAQWYCEDKVFFEGC